MTAKEIAGLARRDLPRRWRWIVAVLGLLPIAWRAAPVVADVLTAPATVEAHSFRISALERADSAVDRRLQIIECFVKAGAKLPGYTNDWCLLNPGREP